MSLTIITNKRQKLGAVLFNPSPKTERGHTQVLRPWDDPGGIQHIQHRPTGVPVLVGEEVPVGPVAPRHTGVTGGEEMFAEADPGVRGEFLDNDMGVAVGQSHQLLVTDLEIFSSSFTTELSIFQK